MMPQKQQLHSKQLQVGTLQIIFFVLFEAELDLKFIFSLHLSAGLLVAAICST